VTVMSDLTVAETGDLFQLAKFVQGNLQSIDKTITAFNLGIDQGVDAGQTIPHLHFHIIPRRHGDVSGPFGSGTVIPGRMIG
jgi:diadenosine tetraphosphate (Ap4A) HIT family hydrolase